MKKYFFTLAGLNCALCTPDKITISENLRPFLQDAQENTDCTIVLKTAPTLPQFCDGGAWHGFAYYDRHNTTARIFHCIAQKTPAFALTQIFENGNIEISVLPEYLSYFTGSSGIFNRIGLETLLLQHRTLLLHASLIKYKDKTIAFAGPSGIGKSTQAALWHEYLGADILNGDRTALRRTSDCYYAYGCPYAGTSGIYKNDSAPLCAIVVLRQAKQNRITRIRPVEAFSYLYPELSIHSWDKDFVAQSTDLLLQLLSDIPVYLLECVADESAVVLTKKGIGL